MKTNKETTEHVNRSDLLCCLEHLKRLFEASLDAFSDISGHALRLALVVELRLVFTKLDQLEARWRYHLPFTEAYDVDFRYWGELLRNWHEYWYGHFHREVSIDYTPIQLSDSFYIDLCNALPSSGIDTKQYQDMSVSEYLASQKAVLSDFSKRKGDYFYAIEQHTAHLLGQDKPDSPGYIVKNKSHDFHGLLNDKLRILAMELYEIDAILRQEHPNHVYADFYARILQHHCQPELSQAFSSVKEWCRNQNPSDVCTEAKVKIRLLSADLTMLHPFENIGDRIDFTKPLSQQHPALGRYIFEHRQQLLPATDSDQGSFSNFRTAMAILSEISLYQQVEQTGSLNEATQRTMSSPLANCFTSDLRYNSEATRKFIAMLRDKLSLVGKGQREANGAIRWGHLYEAFRSEQTHILQKGTTPTEFGRAIAKLLEGVTAQNITRYSQSDRYSKDGIGQGIIDDLIAEFMTIWD